MATIKSHTDLSQSKKLAKILPHESADMHWQYIEEDNGQLQWFCFPKDFSINQHNTVLAWSLAALLDVMPKDKSIDCAISFGYYNGKGEYIEKWICSFEKEGETTDDFIIETTDGDNAIDACVAMIEKLHELKML